MGGGDTSPSSSPTFVALPPFPADEIIEPFAHFFRNDVLIIKKVRHLHTHLERREVARVREQAEVWVGNAVLHEGIPTQGDKIIGGL